MNGTAFLRARTIDWVWHDFWCQVAIAALIQWSLCYAFPWDSTFVDCDLYWHPRMRA